MESTSDRDNSLLDHLGAAFFDALLSEFLGGVRRPHMACFCC